MKTSESLPVEMRPQTLEEVVGQPEAVSIIRGWMASESLPSIILFSGPPGTAKTTLARIVSRLINGVEPGKIDPDYDEQNFSSNGKIDDARELIQTAKFMPRKNLRVIALDEAQGATPQAIQAMLKIFEEPPKHTCWIICTSEPHKLSTAMLSRCSKIALRPYSVETIIKLLIMITKHKKFFKGMDKEQRNEMFGTLAATSDCIPRDSIELMATAANLWQSGDYKDTKYLIAATLKLSDVADESVAIKALLCLYNGKTKMLIKTIRESRNYRQSLDTMLHVNQGLLDKQCDGRPWYTVSQKLFFDQLTNGKWPTLIEAVKMHADLANIKQKLYYGADETNIVLGGICQLALTIKDNKS